ncbi:MAG: hypothetical protein NC184_04475 [Roseburia sp.]|nr:hypothetical protein [Roseburia sp.]
MKYAVIDLSSTGVSAVIAEGEKETGVFEAIYKDRVNIAVADYFDGHSISRRGIEKIIDALISARSTCKAMGAQECYVISTAALRNIDNIEEVAEKIRMRTGMVINYLDGVTEAYCDFVSNAKYSAYDRVILIDIGGNSVELCDFSKYDKDEMVCLDFGPIKLRNKYVTDVYPTEEQAKQIKKYVRRKIDDEKSCKDRFSTAVLVGSINDAIYATYREYCESKKVSPEFAYDKYKKFTEWLMTSPDRTRLIMKTAPEKIHVLPIATLVLKELLKRFKPDNIVISDCGVKEGFLSLVATGREKGVSVDLCAPMPTFDPVAQSPAQEKRKKSDKSSKGKAANKTAPAAGKKSQKKKSAKD